MENKPPSVRNLLIAVTVIVILVGWVTYKKLNQSLLTQQFFKCFFMSPAKAAECRNGN